MQMNIDRHTFDLGWMKAKYQSCLKELPAAVEQVRANPAASDILMLQAMEVACYGAGVDPASPDIPQALRLAAEAGTAVFILARNVGKTVEIRLGGESVKCKAEVDESIVTCGRWLDSFVLNAACRAHDLEDALCATSSDDLRRSRTKREFAFDHTGIIPAWTRGMAIRAISRTNSGT
jgi:hypothetical protein